MAVEEEGGRERGGHSGCSLREKGAWEGRGGGIQHYRGRRAL